MRRTHFLTILAMFFALVLTGSVVRAFGAADRILFSHRVHAAQGMTCDQCHAAIRADNSIYRQLPMKKDCAECHDVKSNCAYCHTNPKAPKGWKKTERQVNFLHSQHKEALANCATCHGADLDKKPHQAGDHKSCGTCHDADLKGLLCAKCHRDLTQIGLNRLNRFSHAENYLREHGGAARQNERICAQCHREAFCSDCHSKKAGLKPSLKYPEAVKRSFIHRGDYLTLHRLDAKTDSGSCLKCHTRAECTACHDRSKVSGGSEALHFLGHPAGWMSKGGPNFHGDEARRDIVACATCHHAAGPGYCVNCHSVSAGISPHPKGWESRVRGLDTNNRMCAKCHNK
jgi:hypothetical protein